MSEWQPIETRPRDARPVLFCLQNGEIIIAPSIMQGLVEVKEDFDPQWMPTHWMPLPEPPSG